MIKWCQMPDEEGLNECGFLMGNVCKANHDHEFRITADFLRCIKIVGCQSWQEYMDFNERRKRFGDEAVRETSGTGITRSATCESDRRIQEMSELSEQEMASGGRTTRRDETLPMRALQSSSDLDGITKDHRHSGDHMKHIVCFVCSKNAAGNHKGFWLCSEHLEKVKNGMSLKEQKDNEELK